MRVEKLSLRNFRNISDSEFFPDPQVNFLIGSNGQGKTTFLEALSLLSTSKSFRDAKGAALIQWGQDTSEVSCRLISDGNWKTDLKIGFEMLDRTLQKTRKSAFINQKLYRSSSQYLTQRFGSTELGFHTIVFNPSDHDLVRGDPGTRRAYLDRALAAEDLEYLTTLQKYQKLLEQRNAILRSHREGDRVSVSVLEGFTEPFCKHGSYLTLKRLEYLQRLNVAVGETLNRIAPSQPDLRVAYLSNWAPLVDGLSFKNSNLSDVHFAGQAQLGSLEIIEQAFWAKISELATAERRSGFSLVGPHRDDWTFFLGEQILKGHGSQGEIRSALLALKLTEISLFRNKTGHRPLFLLDDFSSELDRERRSFLMRFLMETDLQTFVTTTEDSLLFGKRFWVQSGTVKEGSHD